MALKKLFLSREFPCVFKRNVVGGFLKLLNLEQMKLEDLFQWYLLQNLDLMISGVFICF